MLEDQALKLFRQLSPVQKKAVLLSVILSAAANQDSGNTGEITMTLDGGANSSREEDAI